MAIPITNFGLVTVSALYGSGDTTITLTTGHGSRLPATTGGYRYPVVWWNSTDYPHSADDPNKEIVLVTNRSTDTLTVVRAQELTSASAKNTASKTYRMSFGVTADLWNGLRTPKSFHQGLQLQTHRDSDLQYHQVEIVDVESIVMDDGTELRNDNGEWTGKVADITVSGPGGLDQGTEEAFTWYEIYAIAKEDNTRNLIVHKSKIWTIYTNYTINEDASQGIRSVVDNSTVMVAQGFKVAAGSVPFVNVKLLRVGSPTGKIWFTIETDNAGKPSGTIVATSHAFDVARLPTTATLIRFPMKSSQVLSASPVQYHLVARGSWTVSASNYVAWRMDGSAGAYGNGSKALFDSDTSTWTTDTDDDMIFEIGLETSVSSVVMGTDYTKKCFLGWLYNDGSSNFRPFLQVGRSRRSSNISSANNSVVALGSGAQLVDLVSQVPPRPMINAIVAVTGTGTSTSVMAIGDVRATDISSSGVSAGAQVVLHAPTTIERPAMFTSVQVQGLALMAEGTPSAKLWVTGFEW